MSYAVMQTGVKSPSTEQLKLAFRNVPGLTPADAHTVGRSAFGIFAKGFGLETATKLRESLATQGIAAEVVDETTLPTLPDAFFLGRLDCTEKLLLVYDSIGRVAEVEWKDILLIAAGTVVMTEFKQVQRPLDPAVDRGVQMIKDLRNRRFGRPHIFLGGVTGHPLPDLAVFAAQSAADAAVNSLDVSGLDKRTKEEHIERLHLEIVLAGAATRYTVKFDHLNPILFQYLGPRLTKDVFQNFTFLVNDLVHGATGAAINRGAYSLCQPDAAHMVYPNKTAFYNEMVWLLWQKSQED